MVFSVYHVEDGGLVGGYVVVAGQGVVGVVHVDRVRVLQLPLAPGTLQSLPAPLPLHVRSGTEQPLGREGASRERNIFMSQISKNSQSNCY